MAILSNGSQVLPPWQGSHYFYRPADADNSYSIPSCDRRRSGSAAVFTATIHGITDGRKTEAAEIKGTAVAGLSEESIAQNNARRDLRSGDIQPSDRPGCKKSRRPALVPLSAPAHGRDEDPPRARSGSRSGGIGALSGRRNADIRRTRRPPRRGNRKENGVTEPPIRISSVNGCFSVFCLSYGWRAEHFYACPLFFRLTECDSASHGRFWRD